MKKKRAGMIKSYQLNPYFGFKGKLKGQKQTILDFGALKKEKERKKKKKPTEEKSLRHQSGFVVE